MTTTIPAIDILAGLDFDPALPCEVNAHSITKPCGEQADWRLTCQCGRCGMTGIVLVGSACRRLIMDGGRPADQWAFRCISGHKTAARAATIRWEPIR